MKGLKVWLLAGVTAVLVKQKQLKSIKLYQNTAPAQIGTAWTPSQIQAGFGKPVSSSLRHRLKRSQSKDTGDKIFLHVYIAQRQNRTRNVTAALKQEAKVKSGKGYDLSQH